MWTGQMIHSLCDHNLTQQTGQVDTIGRWIKRKSAKTCQYCYFVRSNAKKNKQWSKQCCPYSVMLFLFQLLHASTLWEPMFGRPPLREIDMHISGTLPRKKFWRRFISGLVTHPGMPPGHLSWKFCTQVLPGLLEDQRDSPRWPPLLQPWKSVAKQPATKPGTVGTLRSGLPLAWTLYRTTFSLAFAARRSCPSSTGPECLNFTRHPERSRNSVAQFCGSEIVERN